MVTVRRRSPATHTHNDTMHQPLTVTIEELPAGAAPPTDALAVMRFDGDPGHPAEPRLFATGLTAIDRPAPVEVWRTREPITTGIDDGITWAKTGNHLFGSLILDEEPHCDLAGLTRTAYRTILDFLHDIDRPIVLRAWNYFPRIHERHGGLDRYQSFCIGRHSAFTAAGYREELLPAATLIGNDAPGLRIAFLAAREPGIQIENPRQVSAFRYPQEHGPQSPSFSRATMKDGQLLVSGTASIVGHESVHTGDVIAQTDEIIANLEAVIAAARGETNRGPDPRPPAMRVYLRRPEDTGAVRQRLATLPGRETVPTIFLRGDICREELLVEIETLYGL